MPTALELSPEELRRYRETLPRAPSEPVLTASEQLEREALLQRVAEAATLLKTQFGARRIVLFGSLAHNAWFVSDSDVDLAVEGLQGDFWQAWRHVEEIIGNRQVDLVEIENASNSLQRAMRRYGVEL